MRCTAGIAIRSAAGADDGKLCAAVSDRIVWPKAGDTMPIRVNMAAAESLDMLIMT
jgi:hypothetical protein